MDEQGHPLPAELAAMADRLRRERATLDTSQVDELRRLIGGSASPPRRRRTAFTRSPRGLRWAAVLGLCTAVLVSFGPASLAEITHARKASLVTYCQGCVAPTFSPSYGPPGTVFSVNYMCPNGTSNPSTQIAPTDGEPFPKGDNTVVTQQLLPWGGWESFQIALDGQYSLTITCSGQWVATAYFQVMGRPYAALGDSFASGEGASAFTYSSASGNDYCHRASTSTAWSSMVSQTEGLPDDFGACSGAVIEDFYARNTQNSPEIPQLDHISRLGQTHLVTLTVGGNDIGFVPILTSCVYNGFFAEGSPGCHTRDAADLRNAIGWTTVGRPKGWQRLPGIANKKQAYIYSPTPVPPLHKLYEDIATALPSNGELVVAGYPRLFVPYTSAQQVCTVATYGKSYYIRGDDIAWINNETDIFDNTIRSEVQLAQNALAHQGSTVKIIYVDMNLPNSPFNGHRICDWSTPYFNKLLINFGEFGPDQKSFHPNDAGQQAYGRTVDAALG